MASILRIDERWRALIRRNGYKPVRRYFDTRKDAEAWARKVEAEMDSARHGDRGHAQRGRIDQGVPSAP
ncbi:MAG: site-specific integrase, partial [Burkholderiales bacterium]